jgi:adenylate cyclase
VSADSDTNSKTIMSADIVGSTALYEALGDNAARALVTACLEALKTLCVEHHGRALAEVGDQVIAEFNDPTEAAGTVSEIHLQLHEQYANDPGVRIRMRIGLHYGPVPTSGDVLSGETVKIANWASENAKPEQTLATRSLIDQLPRIFRAVSRYVDDETWNFISLEHVELYEIIWDVESITAYNGEQPARDENSYDRVVFDYENEHITVNVARPVISIGRHKENDLVIDKDLVSRQHLSAQFSRGRCTITDNSTNGSVIRTSAGKR